MTHDRMSGVALITGSAGMLVTMAFHPSGADLFEPGRLGRATTLVVASHSVALLSLPVLFFGALGLTRRLAGADGTGLAALVLYGFAQAAGMCAALASGFIAPGLAAEIVAAAPPAGDEWRALFHYNGLVNQAFARVLVMASSAAVMLWSLGLVRGRMPGRGLGVYGIVLALVTGLGVASGHLQLDVHGFGAVVLGQAIWFVLAGVSLFRSPFRPAGARP